MDRPVRRAGSRWLLASLVALAPGCGRRELPPRGQVLLYIDTDAPLVAQPGAPLRVMDPPALFDQLRVEVLAPGGALACEGCLRDFTTDRQQLADEGTSLGLLLPPGRNDLTVRVRVFRAARLRGDGEPPRESTIDEVFALPAIGAEGVVERTARLSLARVGMGASLAAQPLLAGREFAKHAFDGVTPSNCASAPHDGEVCVPGGAFWMTNEDTNIAVGDAIGSERVVIISPFWVDAQEVSVGDVRRSGLGTLGDPLAREQNPLCTYTTNGATDDLPVTCISSSLAARYCAAQGKALPSEAQFEFLASGLRGYRFVWGQDAPSCRDAIFSRSATQADAVSEACIAFGVGPAPRASGARDVLSLPSGNVYDLIGNVQELTRDSFEPLSAPCWRPPLLVDPVCQTASGKVSVRGGGVESPLVTLRATTRGAIVSDGQAEGLGFRCARRGR
jgi:formylglycine-generating enzyme required for sulfatase activity